MYQAILRKFKQQRRRKLLNQPQAAETLEHRQVLSAIAPVADFEGIPGEEYGLDVAIDGDVAVVGAPGVNYGQDRDVGEAYVYEKSGDEWQKVATLRLAEREEDAHLGWTVGVSGDTIIVGSRTEYGNIETFVFEKPVSGWADMTETARLAIGARARINGDTIVVNTVRTYFLSTGPRDVVTDVRVFQKTAGQWPTTPVRLTASPGNELGHSLAVDGDTIINGGADRIFVYKRAGNEWNDMTESAILTPSNNREIEDVDIEGETIVAALERKGTQDREVDVFERTQADWLSATETARLRIKDDTRIGYSHGTLAVDGDRVVVKLDLGAEDEAFVFDRPSSGWASTDQYTTSLRSDAIGSLAVSNDTFIGARATDSFSGPAVVFFKEQGTISVLETGNRTQVMENGFVDVIQVVLDEQPTENVTVGVQSSDTTEFMTSVSSLVFTPNNWDTPQAINVTGIDDDILDGLQTGQIQLSVSSNDPFFRWSPDVSVAVTNIDVENDVVVTGTQADDVVVFRALSAGSYRLTVNQDHYDFRGTTPTIDVRGNGGTDRLFAFGAATRDAVELQYGEVTIENRDYSFVANDFDIINVRAGGTAGDSVRIHDTAGNDVLLMTPTVAYMQTTQNYIAASGFGKVDAQATTGYDIARFFDSTGDDQFIATPHNAVMWGSGFYNLARGFDYTNGDSTAGGKDRAILYDSATDDSLVSKADVGYLSGNGFFNVARGFETFEAIASSGNDRAYFYDSDSNDRMQAKKGYAYIFSHRHINVARGFDELHAWSVNGGTNRLDLFADRDYILRHFGSWNVYDN